MKKNLIVAAGDDAADLVPDVQRTLAANEAIVQRGLAAFVEVGHALLQIRDARQYRDAGFDRFEDYCRQRFGFNDSRARQLIAGAETVTAVTVGDGPTPSSEGVARELAPVVRRDPERARQVWAATVKEFGPKPTATQTAVTRERIAPKPRQVARRAKPPKTPEYRPERPRAMRPARLPKDSANWSEDELLAAQDLIAGRAITVFTGRLAAWTEKYPEIDISVDYGTWANPMREGIDGDADEILDWYAHSWFGIRNETRGAAIDGLRGKALRSRPDEDGGRRLADFLAALANGLGRDEALTEAESDGPSIPSRYRTGAQG